MSFDGLTCAITISFFQLLPTISMVRKEKIKQSQPYAYGSIY